MFFFKTLNLLLLTFVLLISKYLCHLLRMVYYIFMIPNKLWKTLVTKLVSDQLYHVIILFYERAFERKDR